MTLTPAPANCLQNCAEQLVQTLCRGKRRKSSERKLLPGHASHPRSEAVKATEWERRLGQDGRRGVRLASAAGVAPEAGARAYRASAGKMSSFDNALDCRS